MYHMDDDSWEAMRDAMIEASVEEAFSSDDFIDVPEFLVWAEDADGNLDHLLMACWTFDEAVRVGRGSAIIMGAPTRLVVLQ